MLLLNLSFISPLTYLPTHLLTIHYPPSTQHSPLITQHSLLPPPMSDLYISWNDYNRAIEQLAVQIYQSGWDFNQIICLAKGGLRVGDILARLYEKPLAILSVSSYGGSDGRTRGNITFAKHITMTTSSLGSRILLVDDLVDSGLSLKHTVDWLNQQYSDTITDMRTAVLWYKAVSVFKPDYYVDYLPDNPWIHQPFEQYEEMSPAELAAAWEAQTVSTK